MLDYYDLTTTRGRRSKKKITQGENRVKQKIFELTDITIPESISVKDLSTELKKTSSEIIKKLLGYGILATINNEVDFDTAFLIAGEFGVTAHKKEVVTDEDILFDDSEDKMSVRKIEEMVKELTEGGSVKTTDGKRIRQKGSNLSADYGELKSVLSRIFQAKVQLTCANTGKGKITIPFSNNEDLERIMSIIDQRKS